MNDSVKQIFLALRQGIVDEEPARIGNVRH